MPWSQEVVRRVPSFSSSHKINLRLASGRGRKDTVALLQHDANVHAHADRTLRRASGRGHKDTVALLLKHKAIFDFLAWNIRFLNWGCLYHKSQLFHIRWGVGWGR
jgi:hypothetical protein